MCDICKSDTNIIDYKIHDAQKTTRICPNCAARMVYENTFLSLIDRKHLFKKQKSEISGVYGTIRVSDVDSQYTLTPEEAERLLGHMLAPNEFKALTQGNHFYPTEYLIHDDFYDKNGVALQPIRN